MNLVVLSIAIIFFIVFLVSLAPYSTWEEENDTGEHEKTEKTNKKLGLTKNAWLGIMIIISIILPGIWLFILNKQPPERLITGTEEKIDRLQGRIIPNEDNLVLNFEFEPRPESRPGLESRPEPEPEPEPRLVRDDENLITKHSEIDNKQVPINNSSSELP